MRADAAANRRRVLIAAGEVFAEQGLDASTEEVARRAGVGVGTVFRHFPAKRDLIESTLLEHFAILTEEARAAGSSPDAAAAFFRLTERLVRYTAAKIAMAGYLYGGEGLGEPAKQASAELREAIARLLKRAQDAGGVRHDIGVDDFYFLLFGLAQSWPPGKTPAEAPGQDTVRRRAYRVVIDGLRAERDAPPAS
jgi:AcrR family transcriptional regulator